MSKLTKKECGKAISSLYSMAIITGQKSEDLITLLGNNCDVLMQLINEHFDNPPLKFEELKEGMWVWDNKWKEYVKCNPYTNRSGKLGVCFWNEFDDEGEYYEDYLIFEENRFYRKRVE